MKKRLLSFLVMASLLFTMIVMPAHAITANGTCGDNLTWKIGETGVLTISGTGPMEELGASMPWNQYRTNVKHVWIEEGVTTVADKAFMYYPNVTAVTLPASVTSVGSSSFAACPNLKTITADNENQVYSHSDGVLFNKDKTTLVCYPSGRDATSYTIPSTVKTVNSYAIYSNSHLTRLTIPETVTSIESYGCAYNTGITSLTIPGSLQITGYAAFTGCSSLSYVLIKNGVKTISSSTFSNCTSLATIIMPKSISVIEKSAFVGCTALSNVHYTGTEEEWAKITNRGNNDHLTSAIIRYNYGTYAVTYDANGGEGAPAMARADSGTAITLSDVIPTREGYNFVEWNTMSDGTGSSYAPGSSNVFAANVTLYAIWELTPVDVYYTVSYDANGGENISQGESVLEGTDHTVTDVVPSREGYSFMGWNTKADGSGDLHQAGETITVTQDITLYAIWEKVLLTVSYDANGGENTPDIGVVYYGEVYFVSSTVPSKEGYRFVSWNTQSDGLGISYIEGNDITVTENMTLYAIWELIPVDVYYNVSYDLNGGDDVENAPEGESVLEGADHTVTDVVPSREGYSFMGWNTEADGSGDLHQAGETITVTQDITLYAVWEKFITHTISYNANGGEGAPEGETVLDGMDYEVSSITPEKEGYSFMGWNTNINGTGDMYQAGHFIIITEDITLYAIWELIPIDVYYTVSYDANGGEGAPTNETVLEGTDHTVPEGIPSREGYTFMGWNTDVNGAGDMYQTGETITVTEDITLYAIWEEVIRNYTITYDVDGGEDAPASETVTEGEDYTISSTVPTKEGYTFVSWRCLELEEIFHPGDIVPSVNRDLTFVANWLDNTVDPVIYYTLYFNTNGGEGGPQDEKLQAGTGFVIPEIIPSHGSATFNGWNTELDGTGKYYYPGDTIILEDNTTLHAIWEGLPSFITYTVTYDANGGEDAPEGESVLEGSDYVIPEGIPSREGYIFMGWNTEADGSGNLYQAGETITVTEDMTLYAVWEEIIDDVYYTVTYDANGGENAPAGESVLEGANHIITSEIPSLDGYKFIGWNTEADGSGNLYQAEETITVTEDMTLYAVWEEIIDDVYYTVTYDANGGEDAPTGESVLEGTNYIISSETPSLDGYKFIGWNTEADGSGNLYQVEETITVTEDITLYAIWEKIIVTPTIYNVTYDANGGEGAPFYPQPVEEGKDCTLSSIIPSRDGYKFIGWNTQADGSGDLYQAEETITVTEDITLYAIWEKNTPAPVPSDATITVSSIKTLPGKQVKVALSIKNNPGIISMLLRIDYDNEYLKLVSVEDTGILGDNMHSANVESMPYVLSWLNDTAAENITANGDAVILTFEVSEDAPEGVYPISVSYNNAKHEILNFDLECVDFGIENGGITVRKYIVGDVNGDEQITSLDRIILSRYLAEWDGYDSDSLDLMAADVNEDGKVTSVDRIILARYLSEWPGYETLPYKEPNGEE